MSTAPGPGIDRRTAWLVGALSLLSTVVVAAVLVPWDWVPGGDLVPARAGDLFTPAQLARAEEFAARRRALAWSAYAVSLAVAVGLGLTGAGVRLLRRSTPGPWPVRVAVGVLVLEAAGRLATLPWALLLRQQALRAGLTEQGLGGWLADLARAVALDWAVVTCLLCLLVGSARLRPRRWYLGAGAAAAGLVLAGSFLHPVLVEPVFNRFTPMPAGPFKTSVLRLAEREGVAVEEVLVADASRRTTTLNAYVSGLGASRRVVVYDTLLADLPPAQARVVIAHEIGHAKHRDVLLGTLLGVLAAPGGVALLAVVLDSRRLRRRTGVRGPGDPAAVAPVLALVAVTGLLASPAVNAVSRAVEVRADREALAVTDPGDFVAVQRRLALRSLHDPTPPALSQWWFGSHPTVLERAGLPASLPGSGS